MKKPLFSKFLKLKLAAIELEYLHEIIGETPNVATMLKNNKTFWNYQRLEPMLDYLITIPDNVEMKQQIKDDLYHFLRSFEVELELSVDDMYNLQARYKDIDVNNSDFHPKLRIILERENLLTF